MVQELREVHGTAGRPGERLVQVDKEWSHHVVFAHGPKEPNTGLRVVVGHAEHVPWGNRETWSTLPVLPLSSHPFLPECYPCGQTVLTQQ
jgi:hypothetical protein